MDNDDVLVGRLLSRRELLVLMSGAGLALVVGCSDDDSPDATPTNAATSGATQAPTARSTATAGASGTTTVPSCVVVPELTEGPYFLDGQLERADITSDPGTGAISAGAPLALTVKVFRIGGDGSCEPLQGAIVDVWHCDALGVYSGVAGDTQAFLRGYQVTSADGVVNFTTIYPGWYPGRSTHIHFKIRTEEGYEYTSQWFFDEALSDEVNALAPYSEKGASGRTQNDADGIYGQTGGLLTLDVVPSGSGYASTFEIGLQMT